MRSGDCRSLSRCSEGAKVTLPLPIQAAIGLPRPKIGFDERGLIATKTDFDQRRPNKIRREEQTLNILYSNQWDD